MTMTPNDSCIQGSMVHDSMPTMHQACCMQGNTVPVTTQTTTIITLWTEDAQATHNTNNLKSASMRIQMQPHCTAPAQQKTLADFVTD